MDWILLKGSLDTERIHLNRILADIQANISAGSQLGIQFENEGSSIGTQGAITNVDFVGAGVTASESAGTVTVTIAGGGSGTGNSYFPSGW